MYSVVPSPRAFSPRRMWASDDPLTRPLSPRRRMVYSATGAPMGIAGARLSSDLALGQLTMPQPIPRSDSPTASLRSKQLLMNLAVNNGIADTLTIRPSARPHEYTVSDFLINRPLSPRRASLGSSRVSAMVTSSLQDSICIAEGLDPHRGDKGLLGERTPYGSMDVVNSMDLQAARDALYQMPIAKSSMTSSVRLRPSRYRDLEDSMRDRVLYQDS
ncbi:hypothetical protein GMRT_11140 [Giardia muris]|uniref:Uncharacterized protein n=1 Tax=Giardia muris TaxID=5742 RepID=A0A4Z1TA41_GIAMU|nr:hypothetical protein GMRT_11140 [Giardia muris]|eukprot:TNJ29369.1 hypothetical protein GMRT_11140 [Giardia muris]